MAWYTPNSDLSEEQRNAGLRNLFRDGVCSHAMALLVTGAFLPGMALALGASNLVIGILASLAPMSQMAQIPAILLINRVGLRKLITVVFALLSRLALLSVCMVPFYLPEGFRVAAFVLLMVLFFAGNSVAGCAGNSWIKDIVPEATRGRFLASRLSAATALGAFLTIAAGFGIDGLSGLFDNEGQAYGAVFYLAAVFGLIGVKFLKRVPEPKMEEVNAGAQWIAALLEPVKDPNFRRLLVFSLSWSFTVIMSGAFFAVYMLQRIGLPMSTVILLAVLSQVTNIYFFKVWGAIADRFSNISVLRVSVPLFILLLLLYPFTTMPERHAFTLPLLIFIHIIGGVSTAGFNLCAANIALRLAPHGRATAYLGANAFCNGLAACIAPVIGGLVASFFALREISVRLYYDANVSIPDGATGIPALNFRGIDFVFFLAALTGVYALHRLSLVKEAGTISESAVRDEVFASVRQSLGTAFSFSMGVRRMTVFPYEMLARTTRQTYQQFDRVSQSIRFKRRPDDPDTPDEP